jgi:hypothetical protein
MSKIVTTHLTVDAPVADVWKTITTLPAYDEWNPFITSASGTLALGERLDLTIHPPGGRPMRFRPWVTAVDEHRYVEWLGRVALPGIFDGRHSFTLTPLTSGRTLLQQSETFSGALVPFTGSVLDRTRVGFEQMNEALGRRVARSHHAPPEASDPLP